MPIKIAVITMRTNPNRIIGKDLPSLMKKDPITSKTPDAGPTDKSIPPVMRTIV